MFYKLFEHSNTCKNSNVYIAEEGEDSQDKEGRSYNSLVIQRSTGSEEGRIDHILQVRCFTNLMLNLITMYMVMHMHMHILILHIYF